MDYFEDIKPELKTFGEEVQKIVHDDFVGFYIYGSLTMGAWNPKTSDIDFFVATNNSISDDKLNLLAKLHEKLQNTALEKKLEGEYITLKDLQQKNFKIFIPTVHKGVFSPSVMCEVSADNVLCLIQAGKSLLGEPIENLGLSVSEEEYKKDVYQMLIEDNEEKHTDQSEVRFYLLINALRSIYALETGKLPTKLVAVHYNKNLLGLDLYAKIIGFISGQVATLEVPQDKLDAIFNHGLLLESKVRR